MVQTLIYKFFEIHRLQCQKIFLFFFFVWDKNTCTAADGTTSLVNDCQCSSLTTHDCFSGEFCWADKTCHSHAKCISDDTNRIIDNDCECSFSSTSAECSIGKYCVEETSVNVCVDNRNFFSIQI